VTRPAPTTAPPGLPSCAYPCPQHTPISPSSLHRAARNRSISPCAGAGGAGAGARIARSSRPSTPSHPHVGPPRAVRACTRPVYVVLRASVPTWSLGLNLSFPTGAAAYDGWSRGWGRDPSKPAVWGDGVLDKDRQPGAQIFLFEKRRGFVGGGYGSWARHVRPRAVVLRCGCRCPPRHAGTAPVVYV
jgi:hypothetical protein